MRFPFRDKKTAQAAAYLLRLHGKPLNYMLLIKLLYLADREMLKKHGLPITGDRMVAMRHGPVLSKVLNFINEGPTEWSSSWFDHVSPASGFEVRALDLNSSTDELSRFELRLLDDVYETHGKPYAERPFDLVHKLHKILPEWTDPGDSTLPIRPEDILRGASWSDDAIDRANENAEELCFLESVSDP